MHNPSNTCTTYITRSKYSAQICDVAHALMYVKFDRGKFEPLSHPRINRRAIGLKMDLGSIGLSRNWGVGTGRRTNDVTSNA